MNERRKRRDRRLNPPRHGLPTYYTRGERDRRQQHAQAKCHGQETHPEYATLDMFREYAHPGLEPT